VFTAGFIANIRSSWYDRIPFILLFSIATSVELFQEKLSRETIRHLQGALFHIQRIDTEAIFKAIHSKQPSLLLGPGLGRAILQHSRDYVESPYSFAQTLKVGFSTGIALTPAEKIPSMPT